MTPSTQSNSSASIRHPVQRGHTKKRKRTRGQKPKELVVLEAGEQPRMKLKKGGKGRPRYFDIAPSSRRETAPSKREREWLQRIAHFNTKQDDEKDIRTNNNNNSNRKKEKDGNKFEGMREGEGLNAFAKRLKKESQKMKVQVAKKDNHQRVKKRNYYEKKKEAARKRKLRSREVQSTDDDDDADAEDMYQDISHLPGYWQEIVRNGGRPITERQRKRMRRAEREQDDTVNFGEQAQRPPKLSVLPVRRGRAHNVTQ